MPTKAKLFQLEDIATDKLLGRDATGTGDIEEIGVSGGIEFTGTGGIQTSAFTGDATKTAGGTALTLATVNSNVGSFGSATQVTQLTVNAKGLITAASNVSIAVASTAITDFNEAVDDRVGALLIDSNTIDVTYDDGGNTETIDVKTQMSLTSDASGIKLSGDSASPGNTKLYGTNGSGVKGWYDQPAGSAADHGTLTGLSDDDHSIYALLAGRSGGQTITGGTDAGDDLIINTTTNATKGDIRLASTGGQVYLGGGTASTSLRFYEPSASGTNYVEFVSTALAGNVSFILPTADVAGVLHSDGGGQLSLSKVAVADLANGTAGQLITWAAGGGPTTVATGTSGQVLTSNGAGAAPTFQTTAASGIYDGSGTIPGNVAATLQSGGSFKFEYFGGQDGFLIDDTTGAIYMKDKAAEYGVQITATSVRMFSDGGAGQIMLQTTGGVSINQPTLITTNGSSIDANAALDVASVTKLLYVPRMTTTERNAIATPNDGGVLYNLTTDALTVRANGAWVELGAGGGGAVATDTIWDAKGDLAVGTGADTASKLTVGTNGQSVYADSAAATGLRWGPKIISPAQITADQDNYNPTGWADATIVRLDFDDGIRAITSFSATFDGDIKTLINISDNPAYFPMEHPDGTAANRIKGTGDYIFAPQSSIQITYDSTIDRWYIITPNSKFPYELATVYFSWSGASITAADWGDVAFISAGTAASSNGNGASATLPGATALDTGTTTTGSTIVYFNKTLQGFASAGASHIVLRALVSMPSLSNGTNRFNVYVAIDRIPATSGQNANSCGFRYIDTLNSGNWTIYSKSVGTTEADSGVAVAANTLYFLEVTLDKQRTEARYYINGTPVGRITTDMPTSGPMSTKINIHKAGTGVAESTLFAHSMNAFALYAV